MYTTTEIFKEMLELGMIDKKEYAEMVCEYRNHVRALMEMDLIARDAKEKIDRIKNNEENDKKENNHKSNESLNYGAITPEYVGYIKGILKKAKGNEQ